MKKPNKPRRYDADFRAEVLRVMAESRSVPAATCALNLAPELLYEWQRDAQPGPTQPNQL